ERLVTFGKHRLNIERGAYRFCRTVEDGQYAIAGHVHDASLVCLDVLAEYTPVCLEHRDRATIVDLHEARVSSHVSGKDRRELSAAFGVDHTCTRALTVRREPL